MLLGTRRHPCFVVAAISQIPWVLAAYRAIGLIGSSGFVVQFFLDRRFRALGVRLVWLADSNIRICFKVFVVEYRVMLAI